MQEPTALTIPRVLGTETEFGIASRDPAASDPVSNSIAVIGHYPGLPAPLAVWDYENENPLLDARGFGPDDFARSHRGGSLGRRLLTHVRDVMRSGGEVPTVGPQSGLSEAILAMSRGGLGLVVIVDDDGRVLGVFTDGDLRRAFEKRTDLQAARYFYGDDGLPRPVGYELRNPALAAVLRAVAAQGSRALHEGPVARDIVARVSTHAGNPGRLALADMADYQARMREPLCTDWPPHWRVCGMPPPSSGHLWSV